MASFTSCTNTEESSPDESPVTEEVAAQDTTTDTSETVDAEAVEVQNAALQNSPITEDPIDDSGLRTSRDREACFWNDKKYSDGGAVCESQRLYKCWDGKWVGNGMC